MNFLKFKLADLLPYVQASLALQAAPWTAATLKIVFNHNSAAAAGGANAPAYWAPASLIRPTPKKTPVA